MNNIAYKFDGNKYYIGTANCQVDPLETKLKGETVYLLPANCTWVEPLADKEGFKVKFNVDEQKWEYEEILPEPEPQPYVPSEKERLQQELWDAENQLKEMDYIGTKIATGRATIEEYADKIALMSELAEQVSNLREQIKALDEE